MAAPFQPPPSACPPVRLSARPTGAIRDGRLPQNRLEYPATLIPLSGAAGIDLPGACHEQYW